MDIITIEEEIESLKGAIDICDRLIIEFTLGLKINILSNKNTILNLSSENAPLIDFFNDKLLESLRNLNQAIETLEISKEYMSDLLPAEEEEEDYDEETEAIP